MSESKPVKVTVVKTEPLPKAEGFTTHLVPDYTEEQKAENRAKQLRQQTQYVPRDDRPMDEPPRNTYFVDLGKRSTCLHCKKRYCTCDERILGEWENPLPVQVIGIPPKFLITKKKVKFMDTTEKNRKQLAALLSFFLPGAGQLLNGQVGKAVGFFFGAFIGLSMLILPGIAIWIWGMVDAYKNAKV